MVPGLGLYLDELFFDGYNSKQNKAEQLLTRKAEARKAEKEGKCSSGMESSAIVNAASSPGKVTSSAESKECLPSDGNEMHEEMHEDERTSDSSKKITSSDVDPDVQDDNGGDEGGDIGEHVESAVKAKEEKEDYDYSQVCLFLLV